MSTHTFEIGQLTETIQDYLDDDRFWLTVALAISSVIVWLYYTTHPYPAYGGGLYLEIVETLRANGFHPPRTIAHYTADGIPFAYPPLLFYSYAIAGELGVDLFELMRIFPGVVTTIALIPYYYLARELLGDSRTAGVATVAYATIPAASQWHITGGGFIRAPALLLLLTGLYCALKLFDTGGRRWLVGATTVFGLTVLTHPQYATLFGVSVLLYYLWNHRTRAGLIHGAIVAVGGLLIASPWWLRVLRVYGVTPLTSAASTHGGLLNPPSEVINLLLGPLFGWPTMAIVHIALLCGCVYALIKRRTFVVVWLLVVAQYSAAPRYCFIPGALLIGQLLGEFVPLAYNRWTASESVSARAFTWVLALAICLGAVGAGITGGITAAPTGYAPYLSSDDVTAMEWARAETAAGDEFVVVGDVADWFPHYAERTSIVSPWGAEWVPGQYAHHNEMTTSLVACKRANCLSAVLDQYSLSPDYLYVPNGRVTAGGFDYQQPPAMRQSLAASEQFRIVYTNPDVTIVAVNSNS